MFHLNCRATDKKNEYRYFSVSGESKRIAEFKGICSMMKNNWTHFKVTKVTFDDVNC